MKCYIIDTLLGLFAIDEIGNILSFLDFDNNERSIIEFYNSIDQKIILEIYEKFLEQLTNSSFDEFIFDNNSLASLTSEKLNYKSYIERTSLEFRNFRFNLVEQLKKIGLAYSVDEISRKFKTINEELIKRKVSEAGGQNDIIIIQIIETLDIIKKSISLFSSRLREWYGLYFPELIDKIVEDNILLAKFVSVLGKRENYIVDKIKSNFELREDYVNDLSNLAKNSMGANIDLKPLKGFVDRILDLDSYRIELENNLEDLMEKTAPNLNSVVGSLVGAKLIAKAGNLKKLAYMPASRVQLLGAEKALYRFLKTGEKRPKHGLIFQWQQIRSSKPYLRGKISRLISGKIGIASKIDYFSGDFIGDVITKDVEEKIKEIEQKYPKPPKKVVDMKSRKNYKRVNKKKKN